jgi:hypothetical protein
MSDRDAKVLPLFTGFEMVRAVARIQVDLLEALQRNPRQPLSTGPQVAPRDELAVRRVGRQAVEMTQRTGPT